MTQEIAIPLWRDGRNGNVQFLSSFKRLEKENPDLYKLIEQKEGFECQDFEYSYKVGVSKFGLWLSRRKMGGGQDSRPAIEAAAEITPTPTTQKSQLDTDSLSFTPNEIMILKELAAAISLIKVK